MAARPGLVESESWSVQPVESTCAGTHQHRPLDTWLHILTIEKKYNCIKNMKETNMAVTVLHDQKSSISGAPLTDLEQKRFWTRSGRLQKARWSKWRASSMPLSYLWFQFFRYNCFFNKLATKGDNGYPGLLCGCFVVACRRYHCHCRCHDARTEALASQSTGWPNTHYRGKKQSTKSQVCLGVSRAPNPFKSPL